MTLLYELDLHISKMHLHIENERSGKDSRHLAPKRDTQTRFFCSGDLDIDPMTLIYKLYLDILKTYRCTKNELSRTSFLKLA